MKVLEGSVLDHIEPAEALFGYTYWAHMIPPYKPEHTLMLGYGHGLVAELTRKIWGQFKVTAIDVQGYQKEDAYQEYKMEQLDAFEYVNRETMFSIITKKFDYIAVDLWEDDKVCEGVFSEVFARKLKKISKNLVCFNTRKDDFARLTIMQDAGFKFERFVAVGDNRVSWWKV